MRHALGQFGDTAGKDNWWEKYDFDQDAEERRQVEEGNEATAATEDDWMRPFDLDEEERAAAAAEPEDAD